MNPTAIGTLMDNEFQRQVDEDLNDNSHEPATRGDVRNLALRVELRIMKSESALIERIFAVRDQLDSRITETSERLSNQISETSERLGSRITETNERLGSRITETNERLSNQISETNERISTTNERITSLESSLKDYMYATGWKFFGATIGTMGAMFTVFGIFINSSMK
jgi:flagellar capping protein FliD